MREQVFGLMRHWKVTNYWKGLCCSSLGYECCLQEAMCITMVPEKGFARFSELNVGHHGLRDFEEVTCVIASHFFCLNQRTSQLCQDRQ